jgi:Spy/CpxP family protein refolding chaperone
MKTSPKLILTLLALGLCAAAPLARAADEPSVTVPTEATKSEQTGKRMKKAVNDRDKMLTEKLNLTAEQKEKLTALRKQQGEELHAAKGDRAKMRELTKKAHEDVRALLTPEQQKDFDAMPAGGRGGKGKKGK